MAARRRPKPGAGPDGPTPGSSADAQADADPVAVAKALIARELAVAPRTRAQLADVLARRGVPDAAAEAALDRFAELGYVDDEAFAQAWVRSRHAGKGLSRRALEQELRHRGVPPDTVREAASVVDPDAERAAAHALVTKRLGSVRGLDPAARTRRLVGLLARKGYPPGMAYGVVREVLASHGEVLDDQVP